MRAGPALAASAQWVHEALLEAPPTGVRRRALRGLRGTLAAVADPPVRFELEGMSLLLPLSHDLPRLRGQFPLYSDNLRRLAAAAAAKYADLVVVDIGANVGDSVALVRAAAPDAPILCVEGDPRYLEFLRGDLLLGVDLDDRRHLEEVDAYVRGRRSERYLDVAAFHDDDVDLFESFRERELAFFRRARGADGR